MPTAHTKTNAKADTPRRNGASGDSAASPPAVAQRGRSGRKVRGDARDQLLTAAQQIELMAICGSPGPQSRINAFLVQCGLEPVAKSNQAVMWDRYNAAAEKMGFDVCTLRLLQEMADAQGVRIEEMLGDFSLVHVQKIMAAARAKTPAESARLILSLRSSLNESERTQIFRDKARLDESRLQIERGKLALLEKKASQADAARKTTASTKLTPAEKMARYKQIFGI